MFFYAALMEPVRILLVWVAFGLLWFGYAHGGKEEILALGKLGGWRSAMGLGRVRECGRKGSTGRWSERAKDERDGLEGERKGGMLACRRLIVIDCNRPLR